MHTILHACYAKPLAVYLIAALIALSSAAGPAEAMLVPPPANGYAASPGAPTALRTADLAKVQTVLESKIVRQRLEDSGLSTDEAMARIESLSDEQLHQFAAHADALQAGGDVLGTVLALAIIALLVVLIIYLLEGRIVIQRK